MLNHYLHFKTRIHHSAFMFKYMKGFVSTELGTVLSPPSSLQVHQHLLPLPLILERLLLPMNSEIILHKHFVPSPSRTIPSTLIFTDVSSEN